MTATVLLLNLEVREAVLDARAIRKALHERDKDFAPALAEANRIVVALARGEDPKTRPILSNEQEMPQ